MIAILSPAKSLKFDYTFDGETTLPRFSKDTNALARYMEQQSAPDLQQMMDISEELATLNVKRYQQFSPQRNVKSARPALLSFNGDVYQGFEAGTLDRAGLAYAQNHVRILSGLYGLLRPLDLIQPYRLEMGTKIKMDEHDTLYSFWGNKLVRTLHKDLKDQGDNLLINLASNEYFKAVDTKSLKARVINVDFMDFSSGKYKFLSFYAKKARGMMARFIVDNKTTTVEELKGFDTDGYFFDADQSSDQHLVFKRGG